MTDIVATDHECPLGSDEPDGRDSDASDHDWHTRNYKNVMPDYSGRKTATARWQRSVLIIAALSALSWAVVVVIAITLLLAF
jgi:hypothetical protein